MKDFSGVELGRILAKQRLEAQLCDSSPPLPHLSVISTQESAHSYLLIYLAASCLNVACFVPGNVFTLFTYFYCLERRGGGSEGRSAVLELTGK